MPTGAQTYFESDGKAVNVMLTAAVETNQVAVVEGWLGITGSKGVSGEYVALSVDDREYQFTVPAALAVEKGETVYITVATLTGHTPQDAAYTKAPGAGKVAFFKATSNQDVDTNVVMGIMLAHNALAS